jgi:hypothetical protein
MPNCESAAGLARETTALSIGLRRGLSPQGFHEGVVPGLVVATSLVLKLRPRVKTSRTASGRKEAKMKIRVNGLSRRNLAIHAGLAGAAAAVLAALAG